MYLSTSKIFALSAAIVSVVTAAPTPTIAEAPSRIEERGQNVIIGYRVVSSAQAQEYNVAGTIPDPGDRAGGSAQIGWGTYTTPGRDDYLGIPQDPWYCIIYADSAALDRVSKVWVPESHYAFEGRLWFDQGKIDQYIRYVQNSWEPAKTLRMSIVDGFPDTLQLVIPQSLHNSQGGAMGLSTKCVAAADKDSLGTYRVNYDDWPNNIGGSRTPPEDPAAGIFVK